MAKVKTRTAMLTLPELILHAVTESASIRELHRDGRVYWSADALEKLDAALREQFNRVIQDDRVNRVGCSLVIKAMETDQSLEQVVRLLMRYGLFIGTGLGHQNEN